MHSAVYTIYWHKAAPQPQAYLRKALSDTLEMQLHSQFNGLPRILPFCGTGTAGVVSGILSGIAAQWCLLSFTCFLGLSAFLYHRCILSRLLQHVYTRYVEFSLCSA